MGDKKKYNQSYNDEEDLQELAQLESEEHSDLATKAKVRKELVIEEDDVFFAIKLVFNNIPQVCRVKQNVIDKYIRKLRDKTSRERENLERKLQECNDQTESSTKEQIIRDLMRIQSFEKKLRDTFDNRQNRYGEKRAPLSWVCGDEAVGTLEKNDFLKGRYVVVSLDIQSPQYNGEELGLVLGEITNKEELKKLDEVLDVVRITIDGDNDMNKYQNNLERERKAFDITKDKIVEHGLEMKLVSVHCFFDNSKIIFNYTAASRVDFRNLVKDLASIFKMRIEMRQIGVRDECRIIGGYGQCGKPFCCADVMNSLEAIKITMAKEQNLTLNSLKISGTCGRLLCCLSYEYKTYAQEKADYPQLESKIVINEEVFFVKDINIQTKNIKISSKDDERIVYISREDLEFDTSNKRWIYRGEDLEE